MSRVDLPIPGSPPISTTEPLTSPPPSTRSSSGSPVGTPLSAAASTSERVRTRLREASPAYPANRGLPPASASPSSRVFQAWHSGHWPAHLESRAPHPEQM